MQKQRRLQINAAVVALMLCCSTLLGGVKADYRFSLLPSYSAVVAKAETALLHRYPVLIKLLHIPQWQCSGKQIYFSCDNAGKRVAILSCGHEQNTWDKLWEELAGQIVPLPAERRILLFHPRENSPISRTCQYIATLAPGVLAGYSSFPEGMQFRCDYQGIKAKLLNALPDGQAAIAGFPRFKTHPLDKIVFFRTALSESRGALHIKGEIHYQDADHAAMRIPSFPESITALLVRNGIPQKKALRVVSQFKLHQEAEKLFFESKIPSGTDPLSTTADHENQ